MSSRLSRSIRLSSTLWRALDGLALDASVREGRYRSANAVLEEILRARLDPSPYARPVPAATQSGIDRMRAARDAKQAADRERVVLLLAHTRGLQRAAAAPRARALAAAQTVVEKWRRNGLAAPTYIDAWHQLLETGLPEVIRALERGTSALSAEALAANSPFIISPTSPVRRTR
jgi:hypothetical protein